MVRAILTSLPSVIVGLAILTAFAAVMRPSPALLYAAGLVIAGFSALVIGRYDARRERERQP